MKINLAQLTIDQAAEIELFIRAFQEGDDLQAMRSALGERAIIKRFGDNILGYQLSDNESSDFGFAKKYQPIASIDVRFVNNLLRKAISDKAVSIGFRQVGSDKYEKRDEIAFALGDDKELVAKARWLLRPFSLPDNNKIIYTLLINPGLSYRFKYSFAYLAQYGLNWKDFGYKVRVKNGDESESGLESWEQAHTTLVKGENRDLNTLTCEFRGGQIQDVLIANCWPLANTENRYSYLRRRYSGFKGQQFTKTMEAREDQFSSLSTTYQSLTKLIQEINPLKLNNVVIHLSGLLGLSLTSKEEAKELQSRLANEKAVMSSVIEEIIEDEEEPDEYTQLGLV